MKADPVTRTRAQTMRRSLTRAEVILWARLKGRKIEGQVFRRQHPIGPYIADFACPRHKLVIEADGATHSTPDERLHDQVRTGFMQAKGWTILRFHNAEISGNTDGVVETIRDRLVCLIDSKSPPPSR